MKACNKNVVSLFDLISKQAFEKDSHGDYFKQVGDETLLITAHVDSKTDIWICTYDQNDNGEDFEMKTFSDVFDLCATIKKHFPVMFSEPISAFSS
jgi:hypothetical protein